MARTPLVLNDFQADGSILVNCFMHSCSSKSAIPTQDIIGESSYLTPQENSRLQGGLPFGGKMSEAKQTRGGLSGYWSVKVRRKEKIPPTIAIA